MSTKNEIKQSQVIKRVLVELKTYRLQIVLSLICAVLTVIFTLLVPVLTGKAVDCMIGSGQIQWDGLYRILEKMALAIVGTCFFQWLMNRINNYITYDITKNMRQKAFEKMLVMPIKNIDSHSHGDYMSRIATDADVFSDGLLMGFTQLFTGVLTILGTIFFMVRVSLPIALVVIVLTPVSLLVAKFVASRTYAMFRLQAKHRGEQTAYADEMIENQSVVSAFSYNEKAKEEFDVLNDRLADSSLKATFYSSITNPTTRFVNSLIYSGVGVAGAILAISGGITVGGLTSFLGYASQYAKPFNEISGVVTELQNAIACAARIFEIIDAPAVEESRENHLSDVEGKIVFEDVAFSYDPSKPLIEHLNLTVEPGQRIAIVGPTGSGKTYLVKTLAKLLDVPLAIADATSLTEAGYIGDDIESVVSKLLAAADNDVEKAEQGIIFIDEIDKIAKKKNTNQRDVSGESVQQGMLKLLEGANVEVPVGANSKNAMVPLATVNTRNILFICGGAFPGLEDIIKERLNKQASIGFRADLKDKYDNDPDILEKVTLEDIRNFGMIPEFIGRLPIVFTLRGLTKEMLVKILKEPKNAILKQYQKLLALDEVQLVFEDGALEAIAEKALEKKTGARALRAIIEDFMLDIMYEIPKDDSIGQVTITQEYIENTGGPIITLRGQEVPRLESQA